MRMALAPVFRGRETEKMLFMRALICDLRTTALAGISMRPPLAAKSLEKSISTRAYCSGFEVVSNANSSQASSARSANCRLRNQASG